MEGTKKRFLMRRIYYRGTIIRSYQFSNKKRIVVIHSDELKAVPTSVGDSGEQKIQGQRKYNCR